ncbi:DUF6318 family protein [Isoptericola cucumis]|uniref:DUF6318 domain-containing protein n=1 Tax=Isoptericola cucumis TaxID=1776856 RepID=A0ABQ2B614_9MICO|nr:DUF6318 family protein [Isoptericola cucumis]GGI06068.1 hypothetical protein GCM10007368_09300 [Isoptericola cucumis]
MTRARAILAATSIASAAALLVAGCGDDTPATPSPEPTATASADASPSPSPTSTSVVVAPERPQAMDDDGPAGAEAAAVYFLELDDYIMKTGDTAEWEAMSHKSCGYCTNRLDQANLIAERGDTFEGGEARIRILHTYEQDAATGIWPIDVEIKESRSTITDVKGKVVFEQPAQTSTARVETTRSDGRWVIVGVPDIPES